MSMEGMDVHGYPNPDTDPGLILNPETALYVLVPEC